MTSRLDGELLEVSMGPQHPSTHGVFRMNVALDGEVVRKLKPVFGYLHRNHEKIGENTSYLGSMPYTDRLDYFCSMTNNWAYALSVENLPASRCPNAPNICASFLAEIDSAGESRFAARLYLQRHGRVGHAAHVCLPRTREYSRPFRVAFRLAHDVRLHALRRLPLDLPSRLDRTRAPYRRSVSAFLDEFEALITGNEILIARTQDVGKLSAELAINAGITGPCLRASGVNYDIRKVDGYGLYPRFKFRVPLGDHGDVYDRLMMRVLELRETLGILHQAIGPIARRPDP